MTRKIADIRDEISSGLHPDLPDEQAPLWEDGRNVGFHEQGVKPTPGHILLFSKSLTEPVLGVLDQLVSGEKTVFWGTKTRLFKGVSGVFASNNVTRLTGNYSGSGEIWSISPYGNLTFATRFADKPQVRIPLSGNEFVDLDTVSDLPGTFRANILRSVESFLVAFGTDNSETEIRWSEEDDHTVWVPTASNKARDLQARDLHSPIKAVADLPLGVAIYGQDRVHIMQFIGAPFFFGQDHLLSGIGAVGKHAVAQAGGFNFGFGPQGVWVTDGASYDYIDQPSIHNFVYKDTLDESRIEEVVAWHMQMLATVFFSYPTKDGNGISIGWNYKRKVWEIDEFYRTSAASGSIFGSPITGGKAGAVFLQGGVQTSPGGESVPVKLSATFTMTSGYGMLGYGQGSYGGEISGDG